MYYIAEIESRVAGIPCIIGVIHFDGADGSYSASAPSDVDYYGYVEVEFEVCDRRGRPAPWLERKLSDNDISRIEDEVSDHFAEQESQYE